MIILEQKMRSPMGSEGGIFDDDPSEALTILSPLICMPDLNLSALVLVMWKRMMSKRSAWT